MAFKDGENLAGKGKFYPVFVMDDGDMYSVSMKEEQLELFQLLINSLFSGNVRIEKTPLNNLCSYKIDGKKKN